MRLFLGISYDLCRIFTPIIGLMSLLAGLGGVITDRFDWFSVGLSLLPGWLIGLALERFLRRFEL